MSGIVFLKCLNLEKIREFYTDAVGMSVWLEQPQIAILKHGNMLLGFHEAGAVDRECLITFFFETRDEVDTMYAALGGSGPAPKVNEKYQIYHFFTKDPEGRNIEFQYFLHHFKNI